MNQVIIEQQLGKLSSEELRTLAEMANEAQMTVADFVEYSQKAQIYKNAEERLGLNADDAA